MTHVITGGRRSGKTTKLAKWAKKHANGIIIVVDHQRAVWLSQAHDIPLSQIIPMGTAMHRMRGFHGPVVVDDADVVLAYILGLQEHPTAITITGYNETLEGGLDASRSRSSSWRHPRR